MYFNILKLIDFELSIWNTFKNSYERDLNTFYNTIAYFKKILLVLIIKLLRLNSIVKMIIYNSNL